MVYEMKGEVPAHVVFELRPREDQEASKRVGHYVAKDVEFAVITPPGGNLVVEREVDDEIKERFADPYKAWKDGLEPPEDGTSLRDWPPITPGQIQTLNALKVYTVEVLADLPDAALNRVGPGAVALQQKAQAWLSEAKDKGVVAEQVASLTVRNEELSEELRNAKESIAELESQVKALTPKRGRPRKDEAA